MPEAQTEYAKEVIMLALLQRRFSSAGRSVATYWTPSSEPQIAEEYTPKPNKNADLEALQEEVISRFSKTLAYLAK
ncbi:MAG: hypothetical protein ACLPTZ_26900 [Beijerinckiaceae bacterium]|jgi:hypothetical protein